MTYINKKGFTLIELLAVITIMGILMIVSIPAVSRTIENSRRNTFLNTAKAYINAVKNAVAADELYYGDTPISAAEEGYYYYGFYSGDDSGKDLMEQGGKSSWGNNELKGYVAIHKTVTTGSEGRTKYEYAIKIMEDNDNDLYGERGIESLTLEKDLKRSSIRIKDDLARLIYTYPFGQYSNYFDGVKLTDQSKSIDANATDCHPLIIK